MTRNVQDRKSPSGPKSSYKKSVTLAALTAAASDATEMTAAVAGARVNDRVVANPTADLPAGVGFAGARVSAAGIIAIAVGNFTTAAVTFTSTWDVEIIRE